jgi:superfamily I DNA/RNA helicase
MAVIVRQGLGTMYTGPALDEHVETTSGYASIGTMHLANGLEFRAVAIMACDDEVIPWQRRIEEVGHEADLKKITKPSATRRTRSSSGYWRDTRVRVS